MVHTLFSVHVRYLEAVVHSFLVSHKQSDGLSSAHIWRAADSRLPGHSLSFAGAAVWPTGSFPGLCLPLSHGPPFLSLCDYLEHT